MIQSYNQITKDLSEDKYSKIYSDEYFFDVTGEEIINVELETTQGVKKILRHTEGISQITGEIMENQFVKEI